MGKKMDNVQLFAALRNALEQERAGIQTRLRDLDAALGAESSITTTEVKSAAPAAVSTRQPRRAKRPQNALTLRDAVARVTAKKPLGLADIVERVQGLGYIFASKNPRNSLGAYLYGPAGKKYFTAEAGRFSPLN